MFVSSGQSWIRIRTPLNLSISYGKIHACENKRRGKIFSNGLNVKKDICK